MRFRTAIGLAAIAAIGFTAASAQTPQSSAFTYQGRLDNNGAPVNGVYDFNFDIFALSAGGIALNTVPADNVNVVDGLFTVSLDFGATFNGNSRWLQVRVRPDGNGSYTTLAPRQLISSSPYALAVRLPMVENVSVGSPAFSITNNGRVIEAILTDEYSGSGIPGFSPALIGSTTTGNGVVGLTSAVGGYGVAGIANGAGSQAVRGYQLSETGRAGIFAVSNSANTANALDVSSNGADTSQAFHALHSGLGDCALFEITNSDNVGECVEGRSNGGGDVVQAVMTGTGRAGYFQISNTTSDSSAVYVTTNGSNGDGIESIASGSFSNGVRGQGLSSGVRGDCGTTNGSGVYGVNNSSTGTGVRGDSSGSGGAGVAGYGSGTGVYGQCTAGGEAVYGSNGGSNSNGYAGYFNGRVAVLGSLSKGSGSFKIDHPLDPRNKYLYHSFVESPDMKNIYDGVVALDANGEAVVTLPDWFGALNRDFRYQLTCVGGYAPVYISQEIENNQFGIAGGKAGMKVSWMVTGIRQDPFANANRIPVEEDKDALERGYLLYPEAFGAAGEMNTVEARRAARAAAAAEADSSIPANIRPAVDPAPEREQPAEADVDQQ